MAVAGAAKRYAEAAFNLARDKGTLQQWETQLVRLLEMMQDQSVAEFFDNPAVPEAAKRAALTEMLSGERDTQVLNLAMLLLERGRLHQLDDVVEGFQDLSLEERGIAIADVTTAIPLSNEEQARVRSQLEAMLGKKIELKLQVDPSIIGGIVIRIGDTLIDASVRTHLLTLRRRMAQ